MTGKQTFSSAGPSAESISRAFSVVMRPLVKLLMRHGFTYGWMTKKLKPIFLEVATEDFVLDGKPNSDSRVSLLTGLDRKEIKALRNRTQDESVEPEDSLIGAQLVSIWMTEDRYLDKAGNPAPLPRLRTALENPEDPSFEELFALVTKSIKPRAFLDQWISTNAVTIDEKDCVCINLDSFVTNKTFEEKVFFFERNVHDHIAAAAENVTHEDPEYPDRSIYYLEMSDESVDELRDLSREEGMALLKKVNTRARKLQQRDARKKIQNKRLHLGFYFFSDDDDPPGS